MTARRESDGTVTTTLGRRECNRYSYESHADAAAEAKKKNQGKPPTHWLHVYVCDLCNQHHIGVATGKKAMRLRAQADNKGYWGRSRKSRRARRRKRKAKGNPTH